MNTLLGPEGTTRVVGPPVWGWLVVGSSGARHDLVGIPVGSGGVCLGLVLVSAGGLWVGCGLRIV